MARADDSKGPDLRKRAESIVRKSADVLEEADLSPEKMRQLVHELKVHQIELEMQNEELRLAQLALEQSRDRCLDLYDYAPVAYFTLDKNGLVTEANLTAVHLLGIEMTSLIQRPFSRLVCKDDQDIYYFHYQQVLETRNRQTCEIKLVKKSGEQFHVQLESIAAQDDGGDSSQLRTVVTDITKRKRAEAEIKALNETLEMKVAERTAQMELANGKLVQEIEERKLAERALLASEQKFRLLFEHSLDAVVLAKPDWTILSANPSACRLFDRSEEELSELGRDGLVDTDDPRLRILLEETDRTGQSRGELNYKRKNGAVVYTEVSIAEFRDANGNERLSLFIRDITERKRAENIMLSRLRLIEFASSHSLDELLQATLDEAEALTDSSIGFYHFVESDQRTLWLQAWSKRTLQEMCTAEGKGLHYSIDKAGVWVDCVHKRKPVIHNDYSALPHRRGLPAGHADVIRELVVPVFRGDKLVAVLGVGNKPVDYTAGDTEVVSLLSDFAWDVTERKMAEDALRAASLYNRSLIEASLDPLVTISAEGKITDVNTATEMVSGCSRNELVGTDFADYFADPEKARAGYEQVFRDGSVKNYELSIRHKDERVTPVMYNASIYRDDSGKAVGAFAAARDITDRKRAEQALRESEQRFRAIFEGAEDYIFLKDSSLRYMDVNPAVEKLFGTSKSKIIGRRNEDFFGKEGSKLTREIDSRVLVGATIEGEQTRTVHGIPRTFLYMKTPLRDDSGEVIGILSISRDVTERKRVEVPPAITQEYPSKAMQVTLRSAISAGKGATTVLLTGESGSGKDYLARYIHDHSDRATGPYFSVNCAAISEGLAESELFGHERGSFTGAVGRKRGLLELAEGGTLLLNEIGELSLLLQSKLLTFLDTRKFTRVGGEKEISVNARLITATNRDLEREVEEGRFRKDLFYRLNVFSIAAPPLRERREDIPVLVQEILSKLRREMEIDGAPTIDASLMMALKKYDWPGNVRELHNVLERALILSRGKKLRLTDLEFCQLDKELPGEQESSFTVSFPSDQSLNEMTQDLKRFLINAALRQSRGKKQAAARLLKISRYSLKHYMKTLGYSEEE